MAVIRAGLVVRNLDGTGKVAEAHAREWPESVQKAAARNLDPDKRIVAMLGARGSHVTATATGTNESAAALLKL